MNGNEMLKSVIELANNIRSKKPLIECLTNRVTINDCANMLLAMGASPIMAEMEQEMEEIVSISDGLVLNMGLLGEEYLAAMRTAAKAANAMGKPVVLDPVGVGASKYRMRVNREMIDHVCPWIIRGNMSEILALSKGAVGGRGVDAAAEDAVGDSNMEAMGSIVKAYSASVGSVVCATGAVDIISDGDRVFYVKNGSDMLCDVTGTGCMCTAMTGATAVCGDPLTAAVSAVTMLGIAGELAAEYARENGGGIGTFKVKLFDYIYTMTDEDFIRRGKIFN